VSKETPELMQLVLEHNFQMSFLHKWLSLNTHLLLLFLLQVFVCALKVWREEKCTQDFGEETEGRTQLRTSVDVKIILN